VEVKTKKIKKMCPQLWQRINCDMLGNIGICCGTDEFLQGKNSNLFQGATSIILEKIHDLAIDKNISFVLDSTFSKIDKARSNIIRSFKHKRPVQIIYVYQDPIQAWEFVKARELKDGRHIPRDSFVEEYFNARDVVNQIKKEFPEIKLYLLVKR